MHGSSGRKVCEGPAAVACARWQPSLTPKLGGGRSRPSLAACAGRKSTCTSSKLRHKARHASVGVCCAHGLNQRLQGDTVRRVSCVYMCVHTCALAKDAHATARDVQYAYVRACIHARRQRTRKQQTLRSSFPRR